MSLRGERLRLFRLEANRIKHKEVLPSDLRPILSYRDDAGTVIVASDRRYVVGKAGNFIRLRD